jgi:hypothetical protein
MENKMTKADFIKTLALRPPSAAVAALVRSLPFGLTEKNCVNHLLSDLLLIQAWTLELSVPRGIALIIDGDLGAHYDGLVGALRRVDAAKSIEYAKRAADVLGGSVPSDELDRARAAERHWKELDELDQEFGARIVDEAADALMTNMTRNVDSSYELLVQPLQAKS